MMKEQPFVDLVKKYFGFLVTDYGFDLTTREWKQDPFNAPVFLQSEDFRIHFYMDRGGVDIDAGTLEAPDLYTSSKQWERGSPMRWYSLPSLVVYFKRQVDPDYQADEFLNFPFGYDQIEEQLCKYSLFLKPYWSKILDFFKKENFKQNQKELDDYIEVRAREIIKKRTEEYHKRMKEGLSQ